MKNISKIIGQLTVMRIANDVLGYEHHPSLLDDIRSLNEMAANCKNDDQFLSEYEPLLTMIVLRYKLK